MAARKSLMVLNSVLPIHYTFDDVVTHKLETGKFLFTITGILKMLGIILGGAGLTIFLASDICENLDGTTDDYRIIFPVCLAVNAGFALVLYIIFVCGLTVTNPGFWVYLDIGSCLILSIINIVAAILMANNCNMFQTLYKVPGPVAIASGVVFIASCVAMLLLYRFIEDDTPSPRRKTLVQRLSMFV